MTSPYFRNVSLTLEEGPRDTDVLCGSKSKAVAAHKGNELLRQKIEDSVSAYQATTTLQQRITLNRSIVQFMRCEYGTRFLKRCTTSGRWMLAEDQAIRDKISHALRFASQQRYKREQQEAQAAAVASTTAIAVAPLAVTSLPPAFRRQQEILQDIMATMPHPPVVASATPAVVIAEEEPLMEFSDLAQQQQDNADDDDMPISIMHDDTDDEPMEMSPQESMDALQTDNNNKKTSKRESISAEELLDILTADDNVHIRRTSNSLPSMAAQVSEEDLDFDIGNERDNNDDDHDHRTSAVHFATVLQSLWK